jgi:plasmid stabilization system protein ParE
MDVSVSTRESLLAGLWLAESRLQRLLDDIDARRASAESAASSAGLIEDTLRALRAGAESGRARASAPPVRPAPIARAVELPLAGLP